MFQLLFIFLILVVVFLLKENIRQLITPSILFIFPFFLATFFAAINFDNWGLESLSFQTALLFITGILSFLIGIGLIKRLRFSAKNKFFLNDESNLSCSKLFVSLFIEMIGSFIYLFLLIRWGSSRGYNLSEAINSSMMAGKFNTGEEMLDLPFLVNSLLLCGEAFCLVYMPFFAKCILLHKRKFRFLLFLNVITPIMTTFLSGSRGIGLQFIVAFGIVFIFEYYSLNNWKKKLPAKVVFGFSFFIVLFSFLFFQLQGLIGRSQNDNENIWDSLFRYCGAQIKNFDFYFNNFSYHSSHFAISTFSGIYAVFKDYLGVKIVDEAVSLPFIIYNGYNLGNVYTCFYNYYIDCGVFGVFFFSVLSGFIGQFLFKKSKIVSRYHVHSLWESIYAYSGACLFFCFFGNRFFANLFSASFFRILIWMIIVNSYLKYFCFFPKSRMGKKRRVLYR